MQFFWMWSESDCYSSIIEAPPISTPSEKRLAAKTASTLKIFLYTHFLVSKILNKARWTWYFARLFFSRYRKYDIIFKIDYISVKYYVENINSIAQHLRITVGEANWGHLHISLRVREWVCVQLACTRGWERRCVYLLCRGRCELAATWSIVELSCRKMFNHLILFFLRLKLINAHINDQQSVIENICIKMSLYNIILISYQYSKLI